MNKPLLSSSSYTAKNFELELNETSVKNSPIPEGDWYTCLVKAIEQNKFQLYQQKIVPVTADANASGDHYEILLRLNTASHGVLCPSVFMPAARCLKLTRQIDRWVIETLLTYAGRQLQLGIPATHYSINLSGHTVSDKGLLNFILEQFESTQVDPASICFEFTETVAIQHLPKAEFLINALRPYGCHFSLDDFGQGLSSLARLKQLAVDYLKIDGSFIRNLDTDKVDYAIVEAIQHMASAINIGTIAEHVESPGILDMLREIGVDYAQGFGIHRPEPLPGSL